jgi:hypothetical protein
MRNINQQMKDELQTKMITWVENSAQQISDFAAKEVPPFIKEYLEWSFLMNVIDISLYFLVVITVGCVLIWWLRKLLEWDNGSVSYVPLVIVSGFYGLLSIGIFCDSTYGKIKDCISIKYAPKVFLVNKAAVIIGSKKD